MQPQDLLAAGRRALAPSATLAVFVLLSLASGVAAQSKELESKDPLERLTAVDALLGAEDRDKATKALVRRLKDDDWEVRERAAIVLAEVGTAKAVDALVDVALEGPVERVRRAAARALNRIGAEDAAGQLARKVGNKKLGERASAALEVIAAEGGGEPARKALEKALGARKSELRAAAAAALGRIRSFDPVEVLDTVFADEANEVAVAYLEALSAGTREERPAAARALLKWLGTERPDVVARRVERAFLATAEIGESSWRALTQAYEAAEAAHWRYPGLAARLGSHDSELAATIQADFSRFLEAEDLGVRAAAAAALRSFGASAADALYATLENDPEERVRRAALGSLLALNEATQAEDSEDSEEEVEDSRLTASLFGRLKDDSARMRERAAVALGREHLAAAVAPLTEVLADDTWEVAVTAAVSLGKIRSESALEPLLKLGTSDDWRLRGAAIVGLTHLDDVAAVPRIIEAVEDSSSAIAICARRYLIWLARRSDFGDTSAAWLEWWGDARKKVKFPDTTEERQRREKYGYAPSNADVYRDLEVVVLESAGDHVQEILSELGIEYRLTLGAQLARAGLHPGALYVSNCTGQVVEEDVEILRWFVRTGGWMFGSCWSLSHTIELVYSGVCRMHPAAGEGLVLDDVPVHAASPESPYLESVFSDLVEPIYHLEGAQLVDVLEPESCEVLVDSAACATRWGAGDLTVWFRAGHGLILSSANHFDLQGLEVAPGLKSAEDRQAWAIDRMGLDWARWRELRDEGWWKSNVRASEHVHDRSAFRFITNFVRRMRLEVR